MRNLISDDFNLGLKTVSENQTVRNFRCSKYLLHSIKLFSQFTEQTLSEALLEIGNGLLKSVLFTADNPCTVWKTLWVQ